MRPNDTKSDVVVMPNIDVSPQDSMVPADFLVIASTNTTGTNFTAMDLADEKAELMHLRTQQNALEEKIKILTEELATKNKELNKANRELYSLKKVNAQQRKAVKLTNDIDNMLASIEIGAVLLDRELRIRRVTPESFESLNLLPRDVGRRIENFNHAIEYPDMIDDLSQVLAKGISMEREVRDYRGRWYFIRVLPYRFEGKVAGVILSLVDITRRRRAEDRVQAEMRRRDEFLAMLSHELRNPLAAIVNATHTLRYLGHSTTPWADIIDRQSAHMARLLDDLLDVSRIAQNKFKLRRSIFDLRSLVSGALQTVEPLMVKRRVCLTIEQANEPLWVNADSTRIEQVLVNLLNNAIKFNHVQGQVWLNLESDKRKILIRIRDNGLGIPSGLLESIFDLFVQGDQNIDRAEGGMGVGLTLARHIVQLHDGTITAYSEGLGYGAEFLISFPQAQPLPT